MHFRAHALDGARLYFDRRTGTHVRLEGPAYASSIRRAPRVVQLGLTNRCNLRCSFCFRDRSLESAWTRAEILAWAGRLAELGVLELGFGQGEPLLFPEFPSMVRELARTTTLAINFTTNGLRLDDARIDEFDRLYLDGRLGHEGVGQVRLSYYDDNDPLARVRLLARRGLRFGVNLLVSPSRLSSLRATIEALVDAGCRDLLLLSYNGPDPALHLGPEDDRELARVVIEAHARHGSGLALRLSICLGRRLSEVPQLRLGDDCGAGDDFITIDSEKRLLPCSFHASAVPVESPDAVIELWRARRAQRNHAGIEGCARAAIRLNSRVNAEPSATPRVIVWQAFASNHSTSFTLVGEFSTAAKSAEYVARVEALIEECSSRLEQRRENDRELPYTLWELLGREGEPPSDAYLAKPEELAHFRPTTILAGGRRVLVHDDSTLHTFDIFAHQLLRGHGRLQWMGRRWGRELDLVFGIEAGDAIRSLRPRLGPHCHALQAHGSRLYGIVHSPEIEAISPILHERPRAIACVHESAEKLASTLRGARPSTAPRKRRTEWVLIEALPLDRWRAALAELREDPAGRLASVDWHHPFRMPDRLDAFSLLGSTIIRSEGAPFPAALQAWLSRYLFQIVPQPRIRLRIQLANQDDPERSLRGLSRADVAALSRPGSAYVVRASQACLDILPRNPKATFAQLEAILGGERLVDRRGFGTRFVEVDIMAERPLADAIAQIDADLDAAVYNSTSA